VPSAQVAKIDDTLGFHPAARPLSNLLESGRLAVVQGVGYPRPNRSHFESMDIWHTCQRKDEPRETGWLGRYLDAQPAVQGDASALDLGSRKQPLALAAERVRVPTIRSLDRFRLQGGQPFRKAAASLGAPAPGGGLLGFVQSSRSTALDASQRVEQAVRGYRTPIAYPDNRLAERLKWVAQLLDAGLTTRVYYTEIDGFDTHSQQAPAHEALLRQFSTALEAFLDDVRHQGQAERVLVMVFSEFGRRVQENASKGTDHGAAAPMFLAGQRVRAGLVGQHPSLTELVDGDLQFHTDFRQVYATVLENWLGWPSRSILGDDYDPLDAVNA
jgi:uncharacterized protein (DUF1501 family)